MILQVDRSCFISQSRGIILDHLILILQGINKRIHIYVYIFMDNFCHVHNHSKTPVRDG